MNKDLKLLLISVGLLFGVTVYLWIAENQDCYTEEYQNLSGHHVVEKCEMRNQ
jgi:hypothetical protein